ncbi:type II toxin-antitoxin system RelE/ParE family toxin [Chelativorans xinjiangense]|uniref:type II toxin-antitoxin system RelE/ParE family toxin n=1 Tax=Chelativorans xinjiangense TaxID=2681485 RepID=UPI00135839B4|nr:type II toxin-antitoxin system RelE/ParE family toxin [Chelativorans xinjiangense]
MKRRQVVFAPEARDDLLSIYDWIADAVSPATALAYVERVEAWCRGFDLAAERGRLREEVRLGLRVVGFERRLTVAFTVSEDRVTILRLFYGGRDWEGEDF